MKFTDWIEVRIGLRNVQLYVGKGRIQFTSTQYSVKHASAYNEPRVSLADIAGSLLMPSCLL